MARYSIGFVAEQLGVSASTLRKWESRYGFPHSLRSEGGQRFFNQQQIEELHQAMRLISLGRKPAELFLNSGIGLKRAQAGRGACCALVTGAKSISGGAEGADPRGAWS